MQGHLSFNHRCSLRIIGFPPSLLDAPHRDSRVKSQGQAARLTLLFRLVLPLPLTLLGPPAPCVSIPGKLPFLFPDITIPSFSSETPDLERTVDDITFAIPRFRRSADTAIRE